jgi:hypothetical protein
MDSDSDSSSSSSSSSSSRSSSSSSSSSRASRKRKKGKNKKDKGKSKDKKCAKKRSTKRVRAEKFDPSEKDTNTIFLQIANDVPFAHSRIKVNEVWKKHLDALHLEGHAVGCRKVKTFSAWATKKCRERKAFRLKESRESGVGTCEPATALDDVTLRWERAKLTGSDKHNPLAAELMRNAATSTATSLDSKTAAIIDSRKKYMAKPPAKSPSPTASHDRGASPRPAPVGGGSLLSPPPSGSKSSTPSQAQATRATFNAAIQNLDNSKVDEQLLQLLAAIQAPPSAQPQATHPEVELLRAVLQSEDPLLAPHAAKIYDALGITELAHFCELSAEDVGSVALPKLHQNHLNTLWNKHNKHK